MDPVQQFFEEVRQNIAGLGRDEPVKGLSNIWIRETVPHKYAYNFTWMGRPIIQFPQDMIAMQELIWQIRPQLIVETGIAHGGSLIYYASLLELLGGEGRVLGIDIDIRAHNRAEIDQHPMRKRIDLLQGSSIADDIVRQVHAQAAGKSPVIVVLDSNHTHAHVLQELLSYSPLVQKGSYLVVFDTIVEDLPDHFFENRPWGRGDNPKTAVWEFLKQNDRFEIDRNIEHKLQLTVAPDGWLRCVK
jgi:cephalosporin hydroxylase